MRKAEVEKYKNLLENEGYHIIVERRKGGIYIEIKKGKKEFRTVTNTWKSAYDYLYLLWRFGGR